MPNSSPRSAPPRAKTGCCGPLLASCFVADEIRYFKDPWKADRVLALIIDGEPNATDCPELVDTEISIGSTGSLIVDKVERSI